MVSVIREAIIEPEDQPLKAEIKFLIVIFILLGKVVATYNFFQL